MHRQPSSELGVSARHHITTTRTRAFLTAVALAASCGVTAHGQLASGDLSSFSFREIGPSSTGGRILDIAVDPSRPATVYAASASGGLWKTVNHGTTWECVFQNEGTISIGDVAVDEAVEGVAVRAHV